MEESTSGAPSRKRTSFEASENQTDQLHLPAPITPATIATRGDVSSLLSSNKKPKLAPNKPLVVYVPKLVTQQPNQTASPPTSSSASTEQAKVSSAQPVPKSCAKSKQSTSKTLTDNLSRPVQKALYLNLDKDGEYDSTIQYGYKLKSPPRWKIYPLNGQHSRIKSSNNPVNNPLSNNPTDYLLSFEDESKFVIGHEQIKQLLSTNELLSTYPGLKIVKMVLKEATYEGLKLAVEIVTVLRQNCPSLACLQLFIGPDQDRVNWSEEYFAVSPKYPPMVIGGSVAQNKNPECKPLPPFSWFNKPSKSASLLANEESSSNDSNDSSSSYLDHTVQTKDTEDTENTKKDTKETDSDDQESEYQPFFELVSLLTTGDGDAYFPALTTLVLHIGTDLIARQLRLFGPMRLPLLRKVSAAYLRLPARAIEGVLNTLAFNSQLRFLSLIVPFYYESRPYVMANKFATFGPVSRKVITYLEEPETATHRAALRELCKSLSFESTLGEQALLQTTFPKPIPVPLTPFGRNLTHLSLTLTMREYLGEPTLGRLKHLRALRELVLVLRNDIPVQNLVSTATLGGEDDNQASEEGEFSDSDDTEVEEAAEDEEESALAALFDESLARQEKMALEVQEFTQEGQKSSYRTRKAKKRRSAAFCRKPRSLAKVQLPAVRSLSLSIIGEPFRRPSRDHRTLLAHLAVGYIFASLQSLDICLEGLPGHCAACSADPNLNNPANPNPIWCYRQALKALLDQCALGSRLQKCSLSVERSGDFEEGKTAIEVQSMLWAPQQPFFTLPVATFF